MDTHTDISPLYSNPRRQFVSCVFPSCCKDEEACNSERKSIMEDGEREFQKKTFKIRKELLRNFQQPMWLPNVCAVPSYLLTFLPFSFLIQSILFFRVHSITSNVTPIFNLLLFLVPFSTL